MNRVFCSFPCSKIFCCIARCHWLNVASRVLSACDGVTQSSLKILTTAKFSKLVILTKIRPKNVFSNLEKLCQNFAMRRAFRKDALDKCFQHFAPNLCLNSGITVKFDSFEKFALMFLNFCTFKGHWSLNCNVCCLCYWDITPMLVLMAGTYLEGDHWAMLPFGQKSMKIQNKDVFLTTLLILWLVIAQSKFWKFELILKQFFHEFFIKNNHQGA